MQGATDMRWHEAEIVTNREALLELDRRHRLDTGGPLPCQLCAQDQLAKARALIDLKIIPEDAHIIREAKVSTVVAILIFDDGEEAWGMCLDHLYEFTVESGAKGVKRRGHLRLVKAGKP
jgi:hypothetical protein